MNTAHSTAYLSKQQLIEQLGLAKFPLEIQEEFLKKALELIDKRIKIRLLETLNDEMLGVFRVVSEGSDDRQIAEWLVENVPEMQGWMEEEMKFVREKVVSPEYDVHH